MLDFPSDMLQCQEGGTGSSCCSWQLLLIVVNVTLEVSIRSFCGYILATKTCQLSKERVLNRYYLQNLDAEHDVISIVSFRSCPHLCRC